MEINFKQFLHRKRPLVYTSPPQDFNPIVQVAGCFCTCDGKHLLLKRSKEAVQGDTWTMPGGGCNPDEEPKKAAIRETFEETGIQLDEDKIIEYGKVFVRFEDYDFTYHIFHQEFATCPKVILSHEHVEFRWVTFQESFDLPLILGCHEIIHYFNTRSFKVDFPRKSFYFIRHGEIDLPEDLNLSDCTPLNYRGKLQSEIAKGIVSNLPIESVCFSPVLRARETKDILTEGLDIEHHEIHKLRECSVDTWGKIMQLEEVPGYPIAIEVENFMWDVLEGMKAVLDKSNLPLIVAHGGVHWVLCYHLMIQDHPWKVDFCSLLHFEPVGETDWKVTPISRTKIEENSHL